MRISSNISGLQISRQMNQTTRAIGRALERLSSGKRINSPRDDVAGFSLSVGLESQIRGLKQASLQSAIAQNYLTTESSKLASLTEILQRMRELSVQAHNSLLDSNQATDLNNQLLSLVSESERILNDIDLQSELSLNTAFDQLTLSLPDVAGDNLYERQQSTLTYSALTTQISTDIGAETDLADLNNDGKLDLATAVGSTVNIYLGNGDGSFDTGVTIEAGNTVTTMEFNDYDGDNITDLVVSSAFGSSGIWFYKGLGDGSFASVDTTPSEGIRDLVSTDIDSDGDLDIVGATNSDDALMIYFNDGDGNFSLNSSFALDPTPWFVQAGDINNDGHQDLVVSEAGTSNRTFINDGNGNFTEGDSFFFGDNTRDIQLVDLDEDGNLDAVLAGSFNDLIGIRWGNGDGTFSPLNNYALGENYRSLSVADLDGDGDLDILASANDSQQVELLENLGGRNFEGPVSLGYGGGKLSIGDLNGDYILDFVSGLGGVSLSNTTTVAARADLSLLNFSDAESSLRIIDDALEKVLQYQSELASQASRLDFVLQHQELQSENLASARSQIEDADFALETAELVKHQIMQQAQVAAFGQANVNMQIVLGLFNF